MTCLYCVFESILLRYFQSNFEDMLDFKAPMGLQMGLFWVGGKLVLI